MHLKDSANSLLLYWKNVSAIVTHDIHGLIISLKWSVRYKKRLFSIAALSWF